MDTIPSNALCARLLYYYNIPLGFVNCSMLILLITPLLLSSDCGGVAQLLRPPPFSLQRLFIVELSRGFLGGGGRVLYCAPENYPCLTIRGISASCAQKNDL